MLSDLSLTLASHDRAPLELHLRGALLADDAEADLGGDRLDGYVEFDLTGETPALDGFVEVQSQAGANSFTPSGCMAFPIGGSWDVDHCRYRR